MKARPVTQIILLVLMISGPFLQAQTYLKDIIVDSSSIPSFGNGTYYWSYGLTFLDDSCSILLDNIKEDSSKAGRLVRRKYNRYTSTLDSIQWSASQFDWGTEPDVVIADNGDYFLYAPRNMYAGADSTIPVVRVTQSGQVSWSSSYFRDLSTANWQPYFRIIPNDQNGFYSAYQDSLYNIRFLSVDSMGVEQGSPIVTTLSKFGHVYQFEFEQVSDTIFRTIHLTPTVGSADPILIISQFGLSGQLQWQDLDTLDWPSALIREYTRLLPSFEIIGIEPNKSGIGKYDSTGTEIDRTFISGGVQDAMFLKDGKLAVMTIPGALPGNNDQDFEIRVYDEELNLISLDLITMDGLDVGTLGCLFTRDAEGRTLIAGTFNDSLGNHSTRFIAEFNSLNAISLLQGTVLKQSSDSCIADSTAIGAANLVVSTTDSIGNQFYGITNDSGFYQIYLPPYQGDVKLKTADHYYWDPCEDSIVVAIDTGTFQIADILLSPSVICPFPVVEVNGPPFFRFCDTVTYFIEYANLGTDDLYEGGIQFSLDSNLTVISSIPPWDSALGSNAYQYNLDTLKPDADDRLILQAVVPCDTSLWGKYFCATAHIYPDSICVSDSNWDMSSLQLSGSCNGGQVSFLASNKGSGNMSSPTAIHIIEDEILIRSDSIQLNAGQDSIITISSNGFALTAIGSQSAGHPGNSFPIAQVIGCTGGFGIAAPIFAANDANLNSDHYCAEVRAAYDPNDKTGFPLGVLSENYIRNEDELEYIIRFQNTGNDTAFRIEIVDTLSPYLDPMTFRAGISSHPYTVSMSGNTVVSFLFDPIELPDSNVDLTGSQGFVKYSIYPKPGLDTGTRIENFADIYFDINAPIRTNTTFHTIGIIGQTHWKLEVTSIRELRSNELQTHFFPNPTNQYLNVELEGAVSDEDWQVELYDLQGRRLDFPIERSSDRIKRLNLGNVPAGMYLIRVLDAQGMISTARIVKER